MEDCGLKCAGGIALLGMEWCEARFDQCEIGGISEAVGERARGGALLGDYSNVGIHGSSVLHSAALEEGEDPGISVGVMGSHDAHCHVVSCVVRGHGIGLGVTENASMVVARCRLLDNR